MSEARNDPTASTSRYSSLSEFTNRQEIYAGRHSRVWTAIDSKTKSMVIVKGYLKEKMVPRHHQQVSREIGIMRKINHLSLIVQIYGTFEDDQFIYIIQEHCSKGDLFNRLMDRGGCLSEAEVASKIVTPMLIALVKLHNAAILHRDIKPENIFIDKEDRIRIGDFGLAIDKGRERAVSRIGTLDYMAPEVIAMPAEQDADKGPIKTYDEKVDVWAIGILAYECIAGRPPFEVDDERQTTFLIVTAQISSFPPQFSSIAIDFIQQSLRKDPRQRPSASRLLQHPWVFTHYRRYVEETKDDVIGFYGGAPSIGGGGGGGSKAVGGASAATTASGASRLPAIAASSAASSNNGGRETPAASRQESPHHGGTGTPLSLPSLKVTAPSPSTKAGGGLFASSAVAKTPASSAATLNKAPSVKQGGLPPVVPPKRGSIFGRSKITPRAGAAAAGGGAAAGRTSPAAPASGKSSPAPDGKGKRASVGGMLSRLFIKSK